MEAAASGCSPRASILWPRRARTVATRRLRLPCWPNVRDPVRLKQVLRSQIRHEQKGHLERHNALLLDVKFKEDYFSRVAEHCTVSHNIYQDQSIRLARWNYSERRMEWWCMYAWKYRLFGQTRLAENGPFFLYYVTYCSWARETTYLLINGFWCKSAGFYTQIISYSPLWIAVLPLRTNKYPKCALGSVLEQMQQV